MSQSNITSSVILVLLVVTLLFAAFVVPAVKAEKAPSPADLNDLDLGAFFGA